MDLDPSTRDLSSNAELVRFALTENDAGLFQVNHLSGEHLWSPEARQVFGLNSNFALTAESFTSLVHPEDLAGLLDDRARAHNPSADVDRVTSRYRLRTAAGIRWIRSQSRLERGPDGRVIREQGIVTDMTRTYSLEDQLHSAQRRSSAGLLASSIAHDFNNLLTSILGEVSLCKIEGELSASVEASLDSIEHVTDRAAKLSGQLLSVGKPRSRSPVHFDLNHFVAEQQRILERVLGRRHNLRLDLTSGSLPIYADLEQLGQVILNLVINAKEASQAGDPITIRTLNSEDGANTWASLEVRDRGQGIPEALRSKVFEPYFTTKSMTQDESGRKGTGLGLTSSREIVQRYAGDIEIESSADVGTTVRVRFPLRVGAELDLVTSEASDSLAKPTMVLVLDEDPLGLELAHRGLRAFDLTPISALDAAEALELAREYGDELALLVTTLHTPGMDTREFRHRFGAVCPHTPVLFLSEAASKGEIRLDDVIHDGDGFLLKPSTSTSLSRKVRKLLLQRD